MKTLRDDAEKNPITHLIIVTLLTVGFISLPIDGLFGLFIFETKLKFYAAQIFLRAIMTVVALIFIKKYAFRREKPIKTGARPYLFLIPALLVMAFNAPIIAMADGRLSLNCSDGYICLFIFYCLSVGIMEETIFRGIVLPLAFIKVKDKNKAVLLAAVISSLAFALGHIVNLFSGASVGEVGLQISYTFLTGAVFAISVALTGKILPAVILHAIYDIGGLSVGKTGIFTGESAINFLNLDLGPQWDSVTIIVTAVLALIAAAFYLIIVLKMKPDTLKKLYYGDGDNKNEKTEENI